MMRSALLPAILVTLAACTVEPRVFAIESATPAYGPLAGGSSVILRGTGFGIGPDRVLIGGREAPLAHVLDDRTIDVVIPPSDRPGDAEILVLARDTNAAATGIFHYSTPPEILAIDPPDVVAGSTATITVTGRGFRDEGAGDPAITLDGHVVEGIVVESDTTISFAAPTGTVLARPDLAVVDQRGTATRARAFRYTPSEHGGLLLFPPYANVFAVFYDPRDGTTLVLPRIGDANVGYTAVVRDELADYWGFDRSRQFGRIDMRTHQLEAPLATGQWIPTMVRAGSKIYAISRDTLRFGTFDPELGTFAPIGTSTIPCCGSYGLASDDDGVTFQLVSRQGATISIVTIDTATGAFGTAVPLVATSGLHIEEMRYFDHVLYAASRNGTIVTIDPSTGAVTELPLALGRFNAMDVFEP